MVACLAGVAILVVVLYQFRPPGWEEVEAEFRAEYGIAVLTGTGEVAEMLEDLEVTGVAPGPSAARAAGNRVVAALRAYPPEVLAEIGLERVLLLDEVATPEGDSLGGWAFPDLAMICVSVDSAHGLVVHHEVFHLIDELLEDDGLDAAFLAAHGEGFSYGDHNVESVHRDRWGDPSLAPDGFYTPYAATDVDEDQAEIFGHMMTRGSTAQLEADADPVLRIKADLVAEWVAPLGSFFGP